MQYILEIGHHRSTKSLVFCFVIDTINFIIVLFLSDDGEIEVLLLGWILLLIHDFAESPPVVDGSITLFLFQLKLLFSELSFYHCLFLHGEHWPKPILKQ